MCAGEDVPFRLAAVTPTVSPPVSIEVAVIPAAGRGTRMRPATRVVPKALITVIDRPAIQYAVEEAARAGATEAVIVVDLDAGHLIQQHFLVDDGSPVWNM